MLKKRMTSSMRHQNSKSFIWVISRIGGSFLWFIFLVTSISCHTSTINLSEERLFFLKSEKSGLHIKIENSGNKSSSFIFKLNDNNFNSENEVLKKIENIQEAFPNEPLERKAWRFVESAIDRAPPLTAERWQHSPLLMINSIGFGQCDDYASVLSFIWKKQGFQSRVWGLEGHVVPEVLVNNKWEMYDPNLGIYYLNSKKEVAGVEELSTNGELFKNYVIDDNFQPNDSLSFFSVIRYSSLFADKYLTKENNKVNDWYDASAEFANTQICMPSGASIEFPVNNPGKYSIKGFWGEERELKSFMKITLPKMWVGNISFPFVICNVEGKGVVELNGKDFSIEEDSLNSILRQFTTFNNSLSFKNISEEVQIYCLINPEIFKISGNDTLSIIGTNLENIFASHIQDSEVEMFSGQALKDKLINALIHNNYKFYKNNQRKFDKIVFNPKVALTDKKGLIKIIKLFFDSMDTLEIKEREKRSSVIIEKIEKIYPRISENKGETHFLKFISDPVTFIMFVSVLEVCDDKEMTKLLSEKFSGII